MPNVMNATPSAAPMPSLLGLAPSFGFGDRLGLATPGHIEACRLGRLAPIFAQQSARELTRTQRTAHEVLRCAQGGVVQGGWTAPWGADADHLKTRADVEHYASAGFTFYTIDPSAHVQNIADRLEGDALALAAEDVVQSGAFESLAQIESLYLNRSHELPGAGPLGFTDRESLLRAVVKYGKAIHYAAQMAGWIHEATQGRCEIEMSVDETESVTRPVEHLFVGLEFKRRSLRSIVSLAPRFPGDFEKGVDYKGDLAVFETQLRQHVAIARYCGPYKVSIHSGSDKFSIYPIIGRVCGDLLHVKTAGTNYLEALRVVARKAPALFAEIVAYAHTRFDADRASYHISADPSRMANPATLDAAGLENAYLNLSDGRQVLHVTFGSTLTLGQSANGRSFKEQVLDTLRENEALHREVLVAHLGRHVKLLSAG
jgi:hypothetical protein